MMNYFAIPGLIYRNVNYDVKDLKRTITGIESACKMPKGTLKSKHPTNKPVRQYNGYNLSWFRSAISIFFMDNAQLTCNEIAKELDGDHSSIVVGRQVARNLISLEDAEFMPYYDLVKAIAKGDKTTAITPKPPRRRGMGEPQKQKLNAEQKSRIYEMRQRGVDVKIISRQYGVSRWLIYDTLNRYKQNDLKLAS